jgi:hypothetical protein
LAAVGPELRTEVRHLTIVNTGGADLSFAVATESVTSDVAFEHVTATATGAEQDNAGFFTYGAPSASRFTDVTITATGGNFAQGIWNLSPSTSTLTRVDITAREAWLESIGIALNGDGVVIRESYIFGSTFSVAAGIPNDGIVHIADTILAGPTSGIDPGRCVDVLTPALTPHDCG